MAEIVIRPIRGGDSAVVSELAQQLGYVRPALEIEQWIAGSDSSRVALVAESDGLVVGWIQAHDLDLLVHSRVLEIGGLVVGEGARGRGIGRQLVDAVIEWGRARGHTEVWVRSNVVREGAHGFYEDIGFTRVKTSYSFALRID